MFLAKEKIAQWIAQFCQNSNNRNLNNWSISKVVNFRIFF